MKTRRVKLIQDIFSPEGNPELYRATVEVQTIIDGDGREFHPVIGEIARISSYNNFGGRRVAKFLRDNIFANGHGAITSFRFGREYSPVLYLTVARAVKEGEDYRKLSAKERRDVTRKLLARAKAEIDPDEADIIGPGMIRLWWD